MEYILEEPVTTVTKQEDDKLRKILISEMETEEVLVNLASNEYSKALQLERLTQSIITPVFTDYKNGKLKVISFFAKAIGLRCNRVSFFK